MIDLHTHTTASDGRHSPADLVARAAAAGVTILGLTDHDTLAGCDAAAAACADRGLRFVPGIEVTAVLDERDVHVLGYFVKADEPTLQAFLVRQRGLRVDRIREMVARLGALGIALDADAILKPGLDGGAKAAGRPWIARALVEGGHVASIAEAFDRWLATGKPAFVPRTGAPPSEVVARIHAAGGVASLAHPGITGVDAAIPGFVEAGLDAIEAYHSKHDAAAAARYLRLAADLGVLVTGGSDFHGEGTHGPSAPGSVTLPRAAFDALVARAHAPDS